eukprot:CAMPEP_0177615486 /NCGR_PEP_ID=MMETSP0419_2-20121207/23475_1 /TAXON_ID=582737 /ORGANISM="Tetraselmis sp., Strain GSL018" /LENGTH=373 /DNA_ID=CAMNT_0019113135 /DNA_START=470 /DNA_END=1592 /DNA_ORIENTATION=+
MYAAPDPAGAMAQARTIYVGNVSAVFNEANIRMLFQSFGPITQVRIAGDPSYNTRYCFVEFASDASAQNALSLNGLQLGDRAIRVSIAKQPGAAGAAGAAAGGYGSMMPFGSAFGMGMQGMGNRVRTQKPQDPERVAKTIHIDNVDVSINEYHLAQYFGVCGAVVAVRIAGSPAQLKRKAWVEFQDLAAAQAAFQLDNQVVGSLAIRITPSKTVIHTNGLTSQPVVPPPQQIQQQQMHQMPGQPQTHQIAAAEWAPAEPVGLPGSENQHAPQVGATQHQAAEQPDYNARSRSPDTEQRHQRSRSRSPVGGAAARDAAGEAPSAAPAPAAVASDPSDPPGPPGLSQSSRKAEPVSGRPGRPPRLGRRFPEGAAD